MKKLITIFAMLLMTAATTAQGLNPEAQFLQKTEATKEAFREVEDFAKDKWGRDYQMVIYEINKQSKALVQVLKVLTTAEEGTPQEAIMSDAINKWGRDYNMVMYEYERQMKSYRELGL